MESIRGVKLTYRSQDYFNACQLRDDLLRIPLGLKLTEEDILKDAGGVHYAGLIGDTVVACASAWRIDQVPPQQSHIKQVAVAEGYQGKGLGRWIMDFTESMCRDSGDSSVFVHARQHVSEFYLKLGYETIGDVFFEVGIPHLKMVKKLSTN